jgi:hypothetical protein
VDDEERERARISEDLERTVRSLARKCPECRSEMEKGFLTAPLFLWSKEPRNMVTIWPHFDPSHVITKGVQILARGGNNITILSAYRCEKCKLVLVHYTEIDDK